MNSHLNLQIIYLDYIYNCKKNVDLPYIVLYKIKLKVNLNYFLN